LIPYYSGIHSVILRNSRIFAEPGSEEEDQEVVGEEEED
jgi:hypothetical protein